MNMLHKPFIRPKSLKGTHRTNNIASFLVQYKILFKNLSHIHISDDQILNFISTARLSFYKQPELSHTL